MGRVARYKKVKSCDPYSKKNRGQVNLDAVGVWGFGDSGRKAKKRSLKAQLMRKSKKRNRRDGDDGGGFDLPPSSGMKDEFDLKDLLGSVKKQKLENPLAQDAASAAEDDKKKKIVTETVQVGGNVATIPKTEADERKVARELKVEQHIKDDLKKKEIEASGRQVGESKNAYTRRTKSETRQIIKQSKQKVNEEKRQKKKEFLNNKKSKKGRKGSTNKFKQQPDNYDDDDQEDSDDSFVTGERAVASLKEDYVPFGEQADRPPDFRHIPRGASKKQNATAAAAANAKSKRMTDKQVQAEQDNMEMLRRRVQAQYSAIKLQRRKAGDFHL